MMVIASPERSSMARKAPGAVARSTVGRVTASGTTAREPALRAATPRGIAAGASRRAATPQRKSAAASCLVLAPVEERRELLKRAAARSGWQVWDCGDAGAARSALDATQPRLVVLDLAGASGSANADGAASAELLAVAEQVASVRGVLLLVCGRAADERQELQMRRLGAWAYLPGVSGAGQASSLCAEARRIVDRELLRSGAAGSATPWRAPWQRS